MSIISFCVVTMLDVINQIGNKCFRLQFVGFSIKLANLFIFVGIKCEDPIPESSTKILMVQFGPYTLIFAKIL